MNATNTKNESVIASMMMVVVSAILTICGLIWGLSLFMGFWRAFEYVAAVCVAAGCIGEFWLFAFPAENEDKASPEYKKHRLKELLFITLVAGGVTMDIGGLNHSIKESDEQGKQIAVLSNDTVNVSLKLSASELNNLVLRSNVAALELQATEAKTNIAKIDPLNEPISDVFANVIITLPGGQFVEPPANWWGNSEAADLEIRVATFEGTNMMVGICLLTAYNFSRITSGDFDHSYAITFHTDVRNNFAPFIGDFKRVADLANNISSFKIYAKFIPHDTEITGYGKATICINGGVVTKTFHINNQKALGKKDGGFGTGFADDGFTVIATPWLEK